MDPRRRRLIRAALGAAGLAFAPATRAAFPPLREDAPDAAALLFTRDASRLDPAREPLYRAGSRCSQCFFYQGGKRDTGPCTVFAGWSVPAGGWCREFVPR